MFTCWSKPRSLDNNIAPIKPWLRHETFHESLIFNFLFPRSPFSNVGLFREVSNGSGQLECHSWPIVSTPPPAESSFQHCVAGVVFFTFFHCVFQITCIVSTALRFNHISTLDSSPLRCCCSNINTHPFQPFQPPGTKLKIIDGDIWKFSCQ